MTSGADLAFEQENQVIPAQARVVRDFVNTVRFQVGHEMLQTPDDLAHWLVSRDLLAKSLHPDAAHLKLAKTLREGLRGILEIHAGHDADASAFRRLDAVLAKLPVRGGFHEDGTFALVPASNDPVRAALSRIVDAVRATSEDGTWERLKACGRSSCRWAYFDHSRNMSSKWCTTAGCGNIVKMNRSRGRALRETLDSD